MNRFIVAPSSKNNLDFLLNNNDNIILIGVEDFCITPMFRMNIDDIIDLANRVDKKIIISLNKMMHNNDLEELENILLKVNQSKVDKVLFYDLSVLNICKRINFCKELIIGQEHLNASIKSNDFYFNKGVNYSLITSDITYEEINEINNNSKINLIVSVYGYLPIFYSRRYLITNYLDFIGKKKSDEIYYIKHDYDYYMIKEEKYGTIVYTKEIVNLINNLDLISDVSFYLIDGSYVDDNEFEKVLDNFFSKKKMNDTYIGFFDKKTSYKVKENE